MDGKKMNTIHSIIKLNNVHNLKTVQKERIVPIFTIILKEGKIL